MSHELRTPLHGIIGHLELLGRAPLPAEASERVLRLRQSADALMDVITDVLDLGDAGTRGPAVCPGGAGQGPAAGLRGGPGCTDRGGRPDGHDRAGAAQSGQQCIEVHSFGAGAAARVLPARRGRQPSAPGSNRLRHWPQR
ncbi:hypothetical protein G6F35_015991 [Rhizopus arrhizus]|nr:hypothetical protein G6F35_015991 [Rhizopus arrhizus]